MKKLLSLTIILLGFSSNPVIAEPTKMKTEQTQALEITVYRSPSCGCCSKWLTHLKQNQFTVKDVVIDDVATIKQKYGVPAQLASCHTAIVNGYVIEGHVPADDIKNLINSKAKITGLSVPGMTTGTPGMEMGDRKDPYDVVSFDKAGQIKVFKHYQNY